VSAVFSQTDYRNQDLWPGKCLTGKVQSPINIDPHSRVDLKLKRLELRNYNEMLMGTISNEEEKLTIRLESGTKGLPYVTGGSVRRGKRYTLERCSIHWGDSIEFGSNHRLGDEQFAGEFTCYHYEEKYDSFATALSSGDKKAVLAISWLFKETSGSGNSKWDWIFDLIKPEDTESIAFDGKSDDMELKLTDLIPVGKDYFQYQGSMLEPACEETVSWYIIKDPIPITSAQHDLLTMVTNVMETDRLQNFRYPQKLNKRKVRAYKHHASRKSHGSHRGIGYKSHGHGFKGHGHGFKGHGKFYGSHGYGPRNRGKGYRGHGHGYKGRGKGHRPQWW